MTDAQLKRGIELKSLHDRLWSEKKNLEQMKSICSENMDIAKKTTHAFRIETVKKEGGCGGVVEVSAYAAYVAVCRDIKEIETELEKLDKEFDSL